MFMPVKHDADYTLETLKKERERYKEKNPPPFVLSEFGQEVCEERFKGEWEEGAVRNACIVPNVDTISLEDGKLDFIFSDPDNRLEHSYLGYIGNYHLIFDAKIHKGGEGEIVGTFSMTSKEDKHFSKEEKEKVGLPTHDISRILYFPTWNPAIAKIRILGSQFSVKTKYGNYEMIDMLDVVIKAKPKEKEES